MAKTYNNCLAICKICWTILQKSDKHILKGANYFVFFKNGLENG